MFADKVLRSLTANKIVAGVEVFVASDGKKQINLVVLSKKKSAVTTEFSEKGIDSIEKLTSPLNSEIPIALVIGGKGIIHKNIQVTETDTDKTLLHKVLPNATPDDFYIQKLPSIDNSVYVSVARKNFVDEILQELKSNNLKVISCSLGAFCISSIIPLLNSTSAQFELSFLTHRFDIQQNLILNYQVVETNVNSLPVKVGNDLVDQELLIPFSAAIQQFFDAGHVVADVSAVKEIKEEWKQKQVFKLAGTTLLVFFLSVLLINYFLFTHYWNKKNELNSKFLMNQDAVAKYEKLKTELSERQTFIEKTGLLETSRTSYFADRLVSDLPASIQLQKMNINPVVKKINSTEGSISFTPKLIQVEGACKRSTELNEWIKIIKKKDWVKEVTLVNYSQDKTNEEGFFDIEVQVK